MLIVGNLYVKNILDEPFVTYYSKYRGCSSAPVMDSYTVELVGMYVCIGHMIMMMLSMHS